MTPVRRESAAWEEAYAQTRRSLAVRRRRLRWFDWPADASPVLDLATGDGLDMGLIRECCSGPVVGIDLSPDLLARARGLRVVADAHRLAFADGRFAAVVANSVLHHFDPPRALGEIARVLRPGGRLLMMEPRPCVARSLLDWVTRSFPPGQWLRLLRARRVAIEEELDVYTRWLRAYPRVPGWMDALGLELERQQRTLFGVMAQWRKRRVH